MFRIKESDYRRSLTTIAWLVVVLLSLACLVALALVASSWTRGVFDAAIAVLLVVILTLAMTGFLWLWRQSRVSQIALRQVKLLAHDILASMDQGVVTTDISGLVTSINSGAIRLLEVDFECVGLPLGRLASAEIPLDRLGRRAISRREIVRDQEFTLGRDESARRLLCSASPLEAAGEIIGCVIHLRDVTERMRMKERMWRLERLARLSTLATGLHHEIKNPLTALGIHIQLLEERLRDSNAAEPVDELLGILKTEVRRLSGVLERFRDFANLESLSPRPTDVRELLEEVVRLMAPQAERQNVRIAFAQSTVDPPLVTLDAEKFREVVINLVLNALEAMPAGGELSLTEHCSDNAPLVEVGDTGPGIAPEVRDELFTPYVSTKRQGTGMGLALVEKLVSQHGGQVNYQTGPTGTTFRVLIPIHEATNGVVPVGSAAAGAAP